MGNVCSTAEEKRHHRENTKNRNNPTESYDTWKQKMLLDIGADPLAVVRDFPRMIVYVGTETHHNYLPAGCEHTNANWRAASTTPTPGGPSRRPSENPFVVSSSNLNRNENERNGEEDNNHNSSTTHAHAQYGHHRRDRSGHPLLPRSGSDHGRPPLCVDATGGGNNNSSTTPGVSPGPSPLQAPRLYPGGRTSQREPFREDDAFAARMKRVREEVLLLSELCDERATFGVAFESAWDRLVAQGSNDGAVESEAVSEYLAVFQPQQQQQQQQQDGRLPPPAPKRTARTSLPLDVHQILLNACVDSGMIALAEEQCHTVPTSTTLRTVGASASAPSGPGALPLPARASPSVPSRSSRPESPGISAFQLPDTTAATALLSVEAPADYGGGANAKASAKKGTSSPPPLHHHVHDKDGAPKSSSNSQIRSAASLVPSGAPGGAPGNPSRYTVRSATFHLMQFATQSVMFFPVQRLKHVLWVPWGSHMQDVSWTIHFSLKDATSADLIALKQHTLNTLYNSASTVPTKEANAVGAARMGEASLQLTPSSELAANNNTTTLNAEQAADAFGAAAAAPSTYSEADGRTATTNGTAATYGNTAESKGTRRIIAIQHVLTGRHYVEEADRKTVPRYELDWACSIRIDQETLQDTFAPFQKFAALSHSVKASPLLGEGANSTPPSLMRRAFKSEEENDGSAAVNHSSADPPLQREELGEDGLDAGGSSVNALGAEGIPSPQQPALLQREVIAATVEVVAARVERPPHTMCLVSSTWKKHKEELDYVLMQQYNVCLEDKDSLDAKRLA
ncbi:hypothetical protein ABB37_00948 [Leptomonas pyrrhocoris]|uniref:Uncharacterized protein n=1 Tax=Leptomonas pyrrhocoris TaxID=157538 RepID=A0A0N0E0W1_LEPPY|nr:hypothetical protein ABB37_00948 [Leptomonas pyrrhocoris]XP_015665351.1 hypothetical protein ABB37_00948 [Leptomonas pyrrhocoris]KPA86911.1 hypothetical protein ABB37_00948 [Leptomonas pyrrhocoris]KPA86912.1 hypothetical protein ABB37_00948 [Leptomonas pyrrhocoris]|eukprot:XP_015665350.1 hypothetical protein ABB37_00948 [Leptomonas pyrrhocoris]